MTQAQTAGVPADFNEGAKLEIPRVVRIKPGTANEKSVKVVLPDTLQNGSIDDVIKYAITGELRRSDQRIAERVRNEMLNEYGMTVNAGPAKGNEKVADYFVRKTTPGGIAFDEVEIVIAAKQEGGSESGLEARIDYRHW